MESLSMESLSIESLYGVSLSRSRALSLYLSCSLALFCHLVLFSFLPAYEQDLATLRWPKWTPFHAIRCDWRCAVFFFVRYETVDFVWKEKKALCLSRVLAG